MQSTALVLSGLSLVAVVSTCGADPQERPAFVAGEAIVKFSAASPLGAAVAAAAPERLATDLAPHLETVSDRVGIPLRAMRRTSGNELLVAVDRDALTSRLLERVRADERVASAENAPPSVSAGTAPAKVRVRFAAGSPLAAGVATAWKRKRPSFQEAEAFARELAPHVGFELSVRVVNASQLALTIDLDKLTEALVAALRELPEVDYAQLNQVVGFG